VLIAPFAYFRISY